MYYSEPNTKILFLNNLVTRLNIKNNLIIDYDTQLTNLKINNSFGYKLELFNKTEILLPYEITLHSMMDKISDYFAVDSLIVIDSLNGLVDYFRTYFSHKNKYNSKTQSGGKQLSLDGHFGSSNQDAGYFAFSLLNILFGYHSVKNIPMVLTSYISQRSLTKLIMDLEKTGYNYSMEKNHFLRFSDTVSYIASLDDHNTTLVSTIIKKKLTITASVSELETGFCPRSIKFSIK
ncbi:hypothetical protein [Candidatus Nitrosocosmicus franklandus]|uniref:hypothetical protein n=1 Tax=Candidatus Nitrosocosmicus franklandianus TaxID=1798806 RepID=UPI00106B822D|nr:hypothetical protein [Candidatus Nitrosocosmicus franklandus]